MLTRRKKCNFCKAELEVPLNAQIVECPECKCINGYSAPLTKAPPSKMKQEQSFQKPPQRRTEVHAPPRDPPAQTSLPQGSTSTFGIHGLDQPPTQTPPPPSTQISPPVQTSPPQGSPHSDNNFHQPPIQTPMPTHTPPPAKTSSPAQTRPQTHISPPQASTRPNIFYLQPPQASTRPKIFYRQPPQTSPPLDSLHPAHSNGYHEQPLQASSPDDYYQHPPSPHASPPRVHSSGYYQTQQPFPQISRPQVNISGTWEHQHTQYAGYGATTAFTGNYNGAPPYIQTATKDPTSTSQHVLNSTRIKMAPESGASTVRPHFVGASTARPHWRN